MHSVVRRLGERLRGRQSRRGVVLVYHSIAEVECDPWDLHVSSCHFREHLEVIRSWATPLPLPVMAELAGSGSLPPRALSVTFDDGYASNLYHGRDPLEEHAVPATVFITTGFIDRRRETWWDELESLLLHPGCLPRALSVRGDGVSLQLDLGEDSICSADRFRQTAAWKAWDPAPTTRQAAYATLWHELHTLNEEQRDSLILSLLAQAGRTVLPRPTHRFLRVAELAELASSPMIEIGAHSVSHPALAALRVAEQRSEIARSRRMLEEWLDQTVRGFAYPFGKPHHYTGKTVALIREAGFLFACCNVPGAVTRRTHPLRIPRFAVPNWDGDEFARALRQWFAE